MKNENFVLLNKEIKTVYNMVNKINPRNKILNFSRPYRGNFGTTYNISKFEIPHLTNDINNNKKKGKKVYNNYWRARTAKKKIFNYYIVDNDTDNKNKSFKIINNKNEKNDKNSENKIKLTNYIKKDTIYNKKIFKKDNINYELKKKMENNINLLENKNKKDKFNSKKFETYKTINTFNEKLFDKKIRKINNLIKKEEKIWKNIYDKERKKMNYDDFLFLWDSLICSKSFKDFKWFSTDFFENFKNNFSVNKNVIIDIVNIINNERISLIFKIKNWILFNKKYKIKLSDLGYFLMNITDNNLNYIIIRKELKIKENIFIVLNGNYKYIYDLNKLKEVFINDIFFLLEKLKLTNIKRTFFKSSKVLGINSLILDLYPHYKQMYFN